jgi:hypothetical protein
MSTNKATAPHGLAWHTSSYSANGGGQCVEVAETAHEVYVRDSIRPQRGHLTFPSPEWAAFLHAACRGEL